ncbi:MULTISPECIES: DUF7716 domain-containing protein [Aeromonas]|uniref:DUF7716 domain-containing protein n=1 Tax=Aeromonas TaxID=642 RepID=UPI000A5CB47F|nr:MULTISPECIES: hypothetical protein [Aeromonas]MBO0505918.1 hypothetical protein [Aeromonas veronii]EIS3742097.1 hypothetical protein [Aeromonas hydrophila]MBW3799208.1 hypothetical protein [Aeromonas hydrophila]MBW3804021.1 hypothetical protein [Aeromonas hydrophila]MBW3821731.1 hypothetical protein [Aeromonas hydrophila]
MKTCELINFIKTSHSYPWAYAVYVPQNEALTPNLPTIALDPDDIEDDDVDEPAFAIENGYKYLLSVQTVQSICRNIEMQMKGKVPDDMYMKAFLFYMENDAYITL